MLSDLSEIGEICKVEIDKKIILPIDDLESENVTLINPYISGGITQRPDIY